MSRAESSTKSKMTQQTLFIIKPDAVKRKIVGQIVDRFEQKGFVISKLKMLQFTQEQAKEFYAVHKDKPFFDELVTFIVSGPVVAAIIQGNNAIATTRIMVGATKSFEASPGSIRGDFGLGLSENIIHASDSQQSFEHESGIVFS